MSFGFWGYRGDLRIELQAPVVKYNFYNTSICTDTGVSRNIRTHIVSPEPSMLNYTKQCRHKFEPTIWAVAWDFQQLDILTSVDSDEPVQLLLSLETPNGVQSVA